MPETKYKITARLIVDIEIEITEETPDIIIPRQAPKIKYKPVNTNIAAVGHGNILWFLDFHKNEAAMDELRENIKKYLTLMRAREPMLNASAIKVVKKDA